MPNKICPHCNEVIQELRYRANYSETVFGTSYGRVDFDLEDYNNSDCDQNDSQDWEESDYEYYCPNCDEELDPEELQDEDELPNDVRSFIAETRRQPAATFNEGSSEVITNNLLNNERRRNWSTYGVESTWVCPCGWSGILSDKEIGCACPECGGENKLQRLN